MNMNYATVRLTFSTGEPLLLYLVNTGRMFLRLETGMPVTEPYFGICRPQQDGAYMRRLDNFYALDSRYCSNRVHLVQAYILLERDLLELFDYVEPADSNLATYSHRLYELLLRACTEVETNATGILTR